MWTTGTSEPSASMSTGPPLRAVAYRMLGSLSEADDAVQEAWIRFDRTDTTDVENLRAWLTTVVSRVALNILRSRRTRREDPLQRHMPDVILDRPGGTDPEHEASWPTRWGLRSSWCPSTRSPRSSSAVPRRPVSWPAGPAGAFRGSPTIPDVDVQRQREVVDAFVAAARDGDFEALLAVLDPDVVVRADQGAVPAGAVGGADAADAASGPVRGAAQVARRAIGLRPTRPVDAAGARQRCGRGRDHP